MKRALAFLIAFLLLLFCGCRKTQKQYNATQILLDTAVQITLFEGGNDKILEECFSLCRKYEQLFSTTIPSSDIARINAASGAEVAVDTETAELLRIACDYSKESGGIFDVTVYAAKQLWDFKSETPKLPEKASLEAAVATIDYNNILIKGNTVTVSGGAQIDLGGIAKGYIADRLREQLESKNVTAVINLGGNVCCVGEKNGGFTVGVKKPYTANDILKTIQIDSGSVVTSGCYERYFTLDGKQYHHILNTETGYPVENDLAGVTVICENSAQADYLSTALYAMGYQAANEFLQSQPADAVFVFKNGEIKLSDGLKYKDKETIIKN